MTKVESAAVGGWLLADLHNLGIAEVSGTASLSDWALTKHPVVAEVHRAPVVGSVVGMGQRVAAEDRC